MAGLCCGAVDAHAQSLGEIALREAARRAAITTPSPVYTNVPRRAPAAAPAHTAPEAAPAPVTPEIAPAPVATKALPDRHRIPVLPNAPAMVAAAPKPAPPAASPVSTAPKTSAAGTQITPTASLAGWSSFQIKKTEAELAETDRLADLPPVTARTGTSDIRLPPQHDVMRISTGLGYIQGADFGGDISGSGKINGMQADISAFVTAGSMGFQPRSGRVSLLAPNGKWRAEGGDLFSDLQGLARGGRLSWNAGQRWTPSVSLYLPRPGGSNSAAAVAYRDRFQLLPDVRVGGELASDGARFLQVQYTPRNADFTGFYRVVPGPRGGRDQGVSGGVSLWRGVAVAGALRVSDAADDATRWQLASIRLPLAHQASIALERSWWEGSANGGWVHAVTVQLPLGPVRFIQRLQWGRTDYLQRAVPFGFGQRQIQSTASYTPGPWGTVNYQQSTQWFDDGRMQQWDEIASTLQLGSRTTAQFVTAFPDISDTRRFRARLTQELSPTLALDIQYGRLSAFQKVRAFESERSRFMVTLRRTWQVESPSRGGDVRGRAIDQAGYPVSGALVRLGPYSVITDDAGRYEFTRVPEGDFELMLDKNKLPAAYASDEKPQPLTLTRGSREQIDLRVIPLNTIRGRVYVDRNENGSFDEDEGVARVVVSVNGAVTATSATGGYTFYNQPPGSYTVMLDVSRLPNGLSAASGAEIEVELTAHEPLVGVDFVLVTKDKPIIMRDIRR